MKPPTYAEAQKALMYYTPKDQSGGPKGRRVGAMQNAIRSFLRDRGELSDSNDEASK